MNSRSGHCHRLRSAHASYCRDDCPSHLWADGLKSNVFIAEVGPKTDPVDLDVTIDVDPAMGNAFQEAAAHITFGVARQVPCVLPPQLRRTLDALNGGILVVGTPGSGKTTFLRSIIRYLDTARRIFCVADERGELLTAGHTVHCDVYTRCTKAQAIQMALRCMNPQVIVCDELGTQADLQAVEAGLACGVVFVASVHCDTLEALNRKPPTARLLAMGAFETLVLLDGRVNPGHAVKVRTLA